MTENWPYPGTPARRWRAGTVAVVGQARMQAGIQGNGSKATPVLNYECVFIKK